MMRRALGWIGLTGVLLSQAAIADEPTTKTEAGLKVTLYRDVWGVPHIYADTPAGGAFGLGYAQAEDRIDDVFRAVRTGLGRLAEIDGEDLVDQDYIMRVCRNEEVCKKAWKETPPVLKEIAEAFQSGIETYLAEHPDQKPESYIELEPWMFNTIGRAMILRWPLGTIQDDLSNKDKKSTEKRTQPVNSQPETAIPMRSNEWSVAPSRSTQKCPILHADPHLTWEGLAVLYEARIHAGSWNVCGFFLIGTPLMGYGHNERVGWANTTGGPDTADVYEMKVKPGLIPQYEYDGQWKTPRLTPQKIVVKGREKPILRPAALTHLGPVVAPIEGEKTYVGATPYFDKTGLFAQFYRMNHAVNAKDLFAALGELEYNEQNVMFADVDGNIAYVRNGATPIRPEGYDWNAPVPGNTSATAWQGIHPIEDLVHIFNPPSGYMQNCNISPARMMVDSPMTRDKYKPYIFNVFEWERNPRGDRSTELLDEDSSVTADEAKAYAMDVYDLLAPRWQKGLKDAVAAVGAERMKDPEFAAAVKAILDWNGEWTVDATQTVLLRDWRNKCAGRAELLPMAEDKPLTTEAQTLLVDSLASALADVKKTYGKWNPKWGDAYVVGRGGKYFPMPGADFGDRKDTYNYTETLLSISYKDDPEQAGRHVAYKGSMAMILMFFKPDGVESYSACAWGQSGRPDSPHYVDQSENLFSKRKLKPTFFRKEDLLKNLESERTLLMPLSQAPAADAPKGEND